MPKSCAHCATSKRGARRAGRRMRACPCGLARYCGRVCQLGDWSRHKASCVAARAPPATPSCPVCYEVIAAARAVHCPNGHSLCTSCCVQLQKPVCPVCRADCLLEYAAMARARFPRPDFLDELEGLRFFIPWIPNTNNVIDQWTVRELVSDGLAS